LSAAYLLVGISHSRKPKELSTPTDKARVPVHLGVGTG
jgi:hypothetical protein